MERLIVYQNFGFMHTE